MTILTRKAVTRAGRREEKEEQEKKNQHKRMEQNLERAKKSTLLGMGFVMDETGARRSYN